MHIPCMGDKLVVCDLFHEGEPDWYMVAEDEDGNLWHIQPEWLTQLSAPDH